MNKRGFTLIEILVVIIVIGLLAALVGPRIIGRVSEAKTTTARTQIELLGLALDNYRLHNGMYPATQQGPPSFAGKSPPQPGPTNLQRRQPARTPLPRPPRAPSH